MGKLYAVKTWKRTRSEWEDSTELWATSIFVAHSKRDALRRVPVPSSYDYGNSAVDYFNTAEPVKMGELI